MRTMPCLLLIALIAFSSPHFLHADPPPAPNSTPIPIPEPKPGHPKTNQIEITAPTPLLDSHGVLAAAGWARRAQMTYNRDAIPADRYGRIKEWEHYTIMSPDFTIGLTIAQLGGMAFGSFEVIEYPGGLQPGGFFLKMGSNATPILPSNPYGKTTLAVNDYNLSFAFEGTTRKFTFNFPKTDQSPAITGAIELHDDPKTDSVAIARPFAEGEFFYENKIFGMPAKGSATVGGKTYSLPEGNAWAIYDWGRGIWPHEVGWFWGQAAGRTADGSPIAFNLGHGYGDDSKGTCNAILRDGRLNKLDSVILDYDHDDQMKPWKLTSNDGRLALTFQPIYHQQAKQAILVAKTELHKIHGRFTGTLTLDDGAKLEVKDLLGFMEHAQHSW